MYHLKIDMECLCPQCKSDDLLYNKKKDKYICSECDHIFSIDSIENNTRIFISYGRDQYSVLAEKLSVDLKEKGFEVWYDKDRLSSGVDWESYIEDGLDWVSKGEKPGKVVFILTPHSTRRPDGFCLNEIAMAVYKKIDILPVMLVLCEPPLSICRIQWLDMQDCFPLNLNNYNNRLTQLLDCIQYDNKIFSGNSNQLYSVLKPINFSSDYLRHLQSFTGRQWIIDKFDSWLNDNDKSKIFWVVGTPGVGKTAISTWLINNRSEIVAFHLCNSASKEKKDPCKLVLSVAYQLSTQIVEYKEKLSNFDLSYIINEYDSVVTLFDMLITQPLFSISKPERPMVILIDALDETTENGINELAIFLDSEFEKTPAWLKLVITSRPDAEVLSPLQKYSPLYIDTASKENSRDIELYIRNVCRMYGIPESHIPEIVNDLNKKGEGNFLYVENICKSIESNNFSLTDLKSLPNGISGIYTRFFTRQFSDVYYYKKNIRPILGTVSAAYEYLSLDLIQFVFDMEEEDVNDLLMMLGSLFISNDNKLIPYHSTLTEWLTDNTKSFNFFVSKKSGSKRLAETTLSYFSQSRIKLNYFEAFGAYHLFDNFFIDDVLSLVNKDNFKSGLVNLIKESLRSNAVYTEQIMEIISLATETGESTIIKLMLKEIENAISLGYVERSEAFLDKINSVYTETEAQVHMKYLYAWILMLKGKLLEAKEQLEVLISSDTLSYTNQILFRYSYTIKELGEYRRAKEIYGDLYNKTFESTDRNKILYATQYADILYVKGGHETAFSILSDIVNKTDVDLYPFDDIAEAYRIMGHIHRMNEMYAESVEYYSNALRLFEKSGSVSGQAKIETNMAEALAPIYPDKAIDHGKRAVELNNRLCIPVETGKAKNAMGLAYLFLGKIEKAIETIDDSLALFKQVGYKSGVGMCYVNQLLVNMKQNNKEDATDTLKMICDLFETIGSYPSFVYRSKYLFQKYFEPFKEDIGEKYSMTEWLYSKTEIDEALDRTFISEFNKIQIIV